ncbi:MAG: serine/threonine-protein kinase, partial [Planctomycetota bacterium]
MAEDSPTENLESSGEEIDAKAIFLDSLDLLPEDRALYIASRCKSHSDIESEVFDLLQHYEFVCDESILDEQFQEVLVREIGKSNSVSDEGPVQFKLERLIGGGGCAVVYSATQTSPVQRKVAVKMLRQEFLQNQELLNRFRFEQHAQASMSHPNVVQVLDFGDSDDGHPFFVMELLDGETFTEHCDREKLTVLQRLNLFMEVCDGVQHAHQKGIVHRDLKPTNIVVASENENSIPKLIDFGVAKAAEDLDITKSGESVGTCAYMSPEQFSSSKEVDTRSDIFSLGVILFELLSGRHPFRSTFELTMNSAELRSRICNAEPPELSAIDDFSDAAVSAHDRSVDLGSLKSLLKNELQWIVAK